MTFVSSSFTNPGTRSPQQNTTFQNQRPGTQFGGSPNQHPTTQNQRTATSFNSRGTSNPMINPPVLTTGLNFPNPLADVLCIFPDGQTGSIPCQIQNIVEIPIFSSFTSEELRYFDYLRNGYAVSTIHQSTSTVSSLGVHNPGQTPSTLSSPGITANSYSVDPWRHIPPQLRTPTELNSSQPFGVIPDSIIDPVVTSLDDVEIESQPQFAEADLHVFSKRKTVDDRKVTSLHRSERLGIIGNCRLIPRVVESAENEEIQTPGQRKRSGEESPLICVPPIDEIGENEVPNVTVIDPKNGSIQFLLPCNPRAFQWEEAIVFGKGELKLEFPVERLESAGIGREFPALITLKHIRPNGRGNVSEMEWMAFQLDLEEYCKDHNLRFVGYNKVEGILRFGVETIGTIRFKPPIGNHE